MPNGVMRITLMRDKSHYSTNPHSQNFRLMPPNPLFHHKMARMIKKMRQLLVRICTKPREIHKRDQETPVQCSLAGLQRLRTRFPPII